MRECSPAVKDVAEWDEDIDCLRAASTGHTINRGGYHFTEYGHHFIHLSCSSHESGEILNLVNVFPSRQIDYYLYKTAAPTMLYSTKNNIPW